MTFFKHAHMAILATAMVVVVARVPSKPPEKWSKPLLVKERYGDVASMLYYYINVHISI